MYIPSFALISSFLPLLAAKSFAALAGQSQCVKVETAKLISLVLIDIATTGKSYEERKVAPKLIEVLGSMLYNSKIQC